MKFMTTVSLSPWREPEILDELVEMCHRSKTTDVAVMCMAIPEGLPLLQRTYEAMEQFGRIKSSLEPHGVRAGILVQNLLGHGERWEPISPVKYQRIMGWDGRVSEACFCPLDEEFLKLVGETIQIMAKTEPAFFLIDDDVRLGNHTPATHPCACDLHINLFNQITGRKMSRDAIFHAMRAEDEAGLQIRREWFDCQAASLDKLGVTIRQAIDRVNPNIRCGKCIAGGRDELVQEIFVRTIAGKTHPIARLGGGYYMENGYKFFPLRMAELARQRSVMGDDIEYMCEADSFPQTRYSMSCRTLKGYITGTILFADVETPYTWIPSTCDWVHEQWEPFADDMGRNVSFFKAVRQIAKEVQWLGPSLIGLTGAVAGRPWDTSQRECIFSLGWSSLLGRFGIPFTVNRTDSSVTIIAGDDAWGIDETCLRQLGQNGLLLDGPAAIILTQRGFSDLLGLKALPNDDSLRGQLEIFENHPINCFAAGKYDVVIREGQNSCVRLEVISPKIETISSFARNRWYHDRQIQKVGPSFVAGESPIGGRIAVSAYAIGSQVWRMTTSIYKNQLLGVLNYLGKKDLPAYVDALQDTWMLFGRTKDQTRFIAAIINLNPDPLETVNISIPVILPTSIRRLDESGIFQPVSFHQVKDKPGHVQLDMNIETMQPCILEIK